MSRKGFPESYDVRRLLQFLAELKAGEPSVHAPVYSHLTYDIVPDEEIILRSPDIVIVEGRERAADAGAPRPHRTDASSSPTSSTSRSTSTRAEDDLERWYVDRLVLLRETSLHDPRSFFNFLTQYTEDDDARSSATSVWREVNLVNLRENIAPTRGPRAPRAREGQRPPRSGASGCASSDRALVAASSARTPRRPNHASSAIHAASCVGVDAGVGIVVSARRPTDSAMPTSAFASTRRCSSDAGISMSVEIVVGRGLQRSPSTMRANSGSVRIDAPNSSRNAGPVADHEPEVGAEARLDPLAAATSRRVVASASAVEELARRCRRAARRRARACSGSAGTAPAW